MKHRTAKISRGYYNYRGYCIVGITQRKWVILDEDDKPVERTKTLKAMKRVCDKWERKANTEGSRDGA